MDACAFSWIFGRTQHHYKPTSARKLLLVGDSAKESKHEPLYDVVRLASGYTNVADETAVIAAVTVETAAFIDDTGATVGHVRLCVPQTAGTVEYEAGDEVMVYAGAHVCTHTYTLHMCAHAHAHAHARAHINSSVSPFDHLFDHQSVR